MNIVAPKGFMLVTNEDNVPVLVNVSKLAVACDAKANPEGPANCKSILVMDLRNAIPMFVQEDMELIAILIRKAKG